jgi:hypothetical protein
LGIKIGFTAGISGVDGGGKPVGAVIMLGMSTSPIGNVYFSSLVSRKPAC